MSPWLYSFFLALFRACWQAYVEVMQARDQAVREVPDEKAQDVLVRFRAAVDRLRAKEVGDTGSSHPASGGG